MIGAVFAHPDDETFGPGGTIARYVAAGAVCHLYCATDGGAGRTSGVTVDSSGGLARVRRTELLAAARRLGIASVRTPGHEDGALARVDADALVGEVVDFLREHRPEVVITFGPEGARNAHRDHRAISRAASAAFFLAGLPTAYPEQLAGGRAPHAPRRLYYVSWPPPAPGDPLPAHGVPATARVAVRAFLTVKREAFLLHATQREHLARLERAIFTEDELFAFAAGAPQPAPVVDDLFAGL